MSSGSPLGSHDFIRKNKKVNAKISLVMCVGTQKPALYAKKRGAVSFPCVDNL